MATSATIGKWKLEVDPADTPVTPSYAEVEEVTEVSRVGSTASTLEVTNFDSVYPYKEFISGLQEGDEVTVDANYVPSATVQDALFGVVGQTLPWRLSYDGTTRQYEFRGALTGYGVSPSVSEANKMGFSIKISGDITVTDA